jgi:hypothetical protein
MIKKFVNAIKKTVNSISQYESEEINEEKVDKNVN